MNQDFDYSLLPPCCNSGCTTCVLDYPELYLTTMEQNLGAHTIAMLEAMEKAQQLTETEDIQQWTNNVNKN
jgi:hypothetical protein